MPYKDIQKKTLYQRNYMRMRRAAIREAMTNHNAASAELKLIDGIVRPPVRPQLDADGNVLYDDW